MDAEVRAMTNYFWYPGQIASSLTCPALRLWHEFPTRRRTRCYSQKEETVYAIKICTHQWIDLFILVLSKFWCTLEQYLQLLHPNCSPGWGFWVLQHQNVTFPKSSEKSLETIAAGQLDWHVSCTGQIPALKTVARASSLLPSQFRAQILTNQSPKCLGTRIF